MEDNYVPKPIKILAVSLLFMLLNTYGLYVFSITLHEFGHKHEFDKQDIKTILKINYLPQLGPHKSGENIFSTAIDCEKFNALAADNKQKIMHAGLIGEVMVFLPLIFIAAFFGSYKFNKNNRYYSLLFLSVSFAALIVLLVSIYNNIYSPNLLNDWHLTQVMDCYRYG